MHLPTPHHALSANSFGCPLLLQGPQLHSIWWPLIVPRIGLLFALCSRLF